MRRLLIPLLAVPLLCSGQEQPRGPWLRLGVARSGALQAGEARWFSLRREGGKSYRVETDDASLRLELYDRGRSRVVRSARAGLYVPATPLPGRCWIRLVNTLGERIDYRLTWERYHAAADDHDDSARGATALRLGDPQPGAIERIGDRDWFRVELEAKRDYQFALEGPAHRHLRLELLDSTGERLHDAVRVNGRRRVFLRPLRAGTYCLQVTDLDDNPAVDYSLTWDHVRDDHGDTASTAAALEGGRARGALETYEDEDWFVLPLAPGRAHWISYHGVFTIELIDADGRRVLDSGKYGALRTFTPRTAGPYYLRIPPDMPGRYGVQVHVE